MPVYNFQAFEVDEAYYNGENGSILNEVTLDSQDTDDKLQENNSVYPNNDQLFSIDGGPFTSDYNVDFQDFVVLNKNSSEFEVFAFRVGTGEDERFYVLSKDPGFSPTTGDNIRVSRYSTFEDTNYNDIGSAVCFTAGTLIDTPAGPVPVQNLRVGDRVETLDGGPRPILWINQRQITAAQMRVHPSLKPVVLTLTQCGELRKLTIPQQHAISLMGPETIQTPCPDVLVRAKHVIRHFEKSGYLATPTKPVHYVHFLTPTHSLVWANGILAETFFPSRQALATLCTRHLRMLNRALRHKNARSLSRSRTFVRTRRSLSGKELKQMLNAGTLGSPQQGTERPGALRLSSPTLPTN